MYKLLTRILQFTLCLTAIVIMLGAYTRLKDAGLGCPDWPGCYGKLLAPQVDAHFDATAVNKAWIEMIHRYVAGTLSLLILTIAIFSVYLRKKVKFMWAWAWALVLLIIFQALLGMWTVTMKLNPLVVMGHLLGGIAILSILWWVYLRFTSLSKVPVSNSIVFIAWCALLTCIIQIALGGWTSANYAAVVCADFPTCQGHWLPPLDLANAFAIPNLALENNARVTIQMAHRLGALCTTIICGILLVLLWQQRKRTLKFLSIVLTAILLLQLLLGITNVLGGLPLFISLAHTGVAIMLLLCLITIVYTIHAKHRHH